MVDIRMVAVTNPTRFPPDHEQDPLIKGAGDLNELCGACGFVIIEGLENAHQVHGPGGIGCPACGALNQLPNNE
jgi:hypothetical protein